MKVKSTSVYGVFLNKKREVLLVKDASSGKWGFPGGGIEAGEDHGRSLKRELIEETGFEYSGATTLLICQSDMSKQRYFYRIGALKGSLIENGNDTDILQAAFIDIDCLHEYHLADGVNEIVDLIR